MTTVFTLNGNDSQYVSLADDSSNYVAALTKNTGTFGSVVLVSNLDSGNVVYASLGWDEFDTVAIVPAAGVPGQGVPVLPGQSVLLSVNTQSQQDSTAQLYLAAAVTGTADIVIAQGNQ